ncbi:mechanosensitive ion channel family protein [Pleionea sp. CnH1-48]|uniref:mechanosensitive ion channel family protein n=1 Tax=Pleionea sp. CnH1-48 TaxID=2954494 RepID=UPI0020968592|nr:mechanosensitive ion channel family protein [Pleionea sp. CnH1-48]MCO7225044.1 mechanosensitive ion channel family protein [Pleionea sp. CnH1-48]
MEEIKLLIVEWFPNPWVQFFVWIIAGILVAKATFAILSRLLVSGASKTQNKFDDLLIEKSRTPLFWSIVFFAFYLGIHRLPIDESWKAIFYSFMMSVAIVLWLVFVLNVCRYLLRANANSNKTSKFIQNRTLPLFDNVLILASCATGIYFILVAWNINVGPIVASAGILGLAMSLAAKDTMANLFAGVFILADAPYKLDDYIVLDSGERGKVTHIGIRSTRILTRDDVEVTIPNAIMGNSKIINETAGPHEKYRIRIKIGLAYGSSVQQIREVLLEVANACEEVCESPAARVRFRTFGDSSINFELLCWVAEPELRGKVSDLLNEAVYDAMSQHNITIPFPQRDVNLRQVSGPS